MDQTTIQTIKNYLKKLPKNILPNEVVVFGSRARGTHQKGSDIDVAIISTSFRKLKDPDRSRLLYRATEDIFPEIHPWGFSPEEFAAAHKQSSVGTIRDTGVKISL